MLLAADLSLHDPESSARFLVEENSIFAGKYSYTYKISMLLKLAGLLLKNFLLCGFWNKDYSCLCNCTK